MKLFFAMCFFLVILFPHLAQGMVIQQVSLKEVVELCTDVCVGVVDRLETEQDPLTGIIYTLARITVEDCVLGVVQDTELTVKTLGGEVGEVGLFVPGMPLFEEGEEVLLLLLDDGQGSYRVISGAIGKYTITDDSLTGRRMASNSIDGILAIDEDVGEMGAQLQGPPQGEYPIYAPLPRNIPLDDFLDLIDQAGRR